MLLRWTGGVAKQVVQAVVVDFVAEDFEVLDGRLDHLVDEWANGRDDPCMGAESMLEEPTPILREVDRVEHARLRLGRKLGEKLADFAFGK